MRNLMKDLTETEMRWTDLGKMSKADKTNLMRIILPLWRIAGPSKLRGMRRICLDGTTRSQWSLHNSKRQTNALERERERVNRVTEDGLKRGGDGGI